MSVSPTTAPIDLSLPRLRVQMDRGYAGGFLMDLGQRNAALIKRRLGPLRRNLRWMQACAPLPDWGYDLIHTLNVVPLWTPKPYIITFEDFLPRVPEDRYVAWLEAALRPRLVSPQCVALIAMSDYAVRQFRWQNRSYPHLPALEAKLRQIYPGVALRRQTPKRPAGRQLRLLFVGRNYLCKGGPALVRAHERLRRAGIPVHSTVVSTLSMHDHVTPLDTAYQRQEIMRLRQDGIERHANLSNDRVMALMEAADYFIFPTLHDTFGYVSLEALACGTPVLATRTAAQAEVVEDGKSGWLLPFENEAHIGKWMWLYRRRDPRYTEAYDQTIERLGEALAAQLERCWAFTSEEYERLSAGALDRVRQRFLRERIAQQLEPLYELCRAGAWRAQ